MPEPAPKEQSADGMLEELLEIVRQQARNPFRPCRRLRPDEKAVVAVAGRLGRAAEYEEIDKRKRRIPVDVPGQ